MVATLVALMIHAAPIAADAPENASLVPSSTVESGAPSASLEVTQTAPRGSAGWLLGGVAGGAFVTASAMIPVALAIPTQHGNTGLLIGLPIAGGIAGGIGGWFLGDIARDTTWGKVAVIVVDVLASLGVSALMVGTGLVLGSLGNLAGVSM